ncbi:hypothetical protein B0H14DRAFT_2650796 [Mycena olivaceomarginata]|nr:hypothetical protein B0H14DRAFT_2650796 [Mycena olivaceomarginata]
MPEPAAGLKSTDNILIESSWNLFTNHAGLDLKQIILLEKSLNYFSSWSAATHGGHLRRTTSRSGLPRSAAARRTHPLSPKGLNAVTVHGRSSSGSASVAMAGCTPGVVDDRVQAAQEVDGGSRERMAPNLAARALNGGRDRSGESVEVVWGKTVANGRYWTGELTTAVKCPRLDTAGTTTTTWGWWW